MTASMGLTWNAATPGTFPIASYNIYRGGVKIASATSTSYTDTGLANSTAYTYDVTAVDSHGNESAHSVSATATTLGAGTLPSGVTLQAIDGETMSGMTMSHNFYGRNGYTQVTTGTGYPTNWDDISYFPIQVVYTIGNSGDGNVTSAAAVGGLALQTPVSNGVYGGEEGYLAPHQIYGFIHVGDHNPQGTWTVGLHHDENPQYVTGINGVYGELANWTGMMFQSVLTYNQWHTGYISNTSGSSPPNVTSMAHLLQMSSAVSGLSKPIASFGMDLYWFAGSNDSSFFWGQASSVLSTTTRDTVARGSHYGNMVDVFRSWANNQNQGDCNGAAATNGATSPIILAPYIETYFGRWTDNNFWHPPVSTIIQPDELVWAIWSTVVHGARCLQLFSLTQDEPTPPTTAQAAINDGMPRGINPGQTRSIYIAAQSACKLICNLASVINSPFAIGYASATPHGYTFPQAEANWLNGGIETCVHWYQGGSYTPSSGPLSGVTITNGFYIFATTRNGETVTNSTATFTVNHPGATSVNVLGESRSIAISGGGFSDTFANAWTVHIYQVVGP